MNNHDSYFSYLQQRSWLGLAYRRWWLYPRLCRYLKGNVIDIGCGIGDMLSFRPRTVGVDINPINVAWCRAHGMNAQVMEPDHLPFSDAEFECALLDNVLEHLQSPMPLLKEIRRILVSDGILVVGVPGKCGYACDPDHKVYYDETALVAVMAKAGLAMETIFYMPIRSDWLDVRMRQYCIYGVFRRG